MSLQQLKQRLGDVYQLGRAAALLGWDQQVMMPRGGAPARAEQLAVLSKITHEMLVADETRRLLEAAENEVAKAAYDSEDAAYVRAARYDFDQATRLPTELVEEFERVTSQAHEVWADARQNNEFAHFQPLLERIFDLAKQSAEYLGYPEKPYDAMLNRFEPGMTSAEVTRIFADLREELVPLVKAISEKQDAVDDSVLHQAFPIDKQREFGESVIRQFGYEFNKGRQDLAVHPFCISFSCNDVRITTRFDPNWLNPALFGTLHETGHALYELGIPEKWDGNLLSDAASLGVHESQSRLWENVVGRSRGFWSHYYSQLQATFPEALGQVDLDTFYRAINKTSPSFVRVEADEVTYNLHIMLRYDIEQAVMNDGMAVKDLPEFWNTKFQEYLGIVPPTNTLGVLQDVHWSSGLIGYFPTYSLGNLLSVQFYEQAVKDHPSIPNEIANGKFDTLLHWMRTHIHSQGRMYRPMELVQRITGTGIQVKPFMNYLRAKFSEIYGLEPAAIGK